MEVAEAAGCVQARDGVAGGVEHLAVYVLLRAAERGAGARVDGVGVVGAFLGEGHERGGGAIEALVAALLAEAVVLGDGGHERIGVHPGVPVLHLGGELLKGVGLHDPALVNLGLVVLAPAVPVANLVGQVACEVAALEEVALARGELAGLEGGLVKDAPGGNAVEVADAIVERNERVPAVVGRAGVVLVDEALAQAVHPDVGGAGREGEDGEVVLGVARVHGGHRDDVVHVPKLRADLLNHADAVAGVEAPALELEGINLEVLVLELLVELKAAAAHDDALARLDGLGGLVVADERVGTYDLTRGGVLDEVLVVAVEQDLGPEFSALGVELVEGLHAEALNGGKALAAGELVLVELVVLGDGAGQGRVHDLVGHAVLVGILGVACAFLDPGIGHVVGDGALGERAQVLLEGLLLVLGNDGPLAVVDAGVAAALHRGLLKDENFLAALVGADERGPHACSAVADDEQVALVVPGCGQPGVVDGLVGRCNGCAGECGHASCCAGPLHEVATRYAVAHVLPLSVAWCSFCRF